MTSEEKTSNESKKKDSKKKDSKQIIPPVNPDQFQIIPMTEPPKKEKK